MFPLVCRQLLSCHAFMLLFCVCPYIVDVSYYCPNFLFFKELQVGECPNIVTLTFHIFKVSTSNDSHIMLCWHLENIVCDKVQSTIATWISKIYTFSLHKTYSSPSQQTDLNLYKYQPKGPCFIKYINHE